LFVAIAIVAGRRSFSLENNGRIVWLFFKDVVRVQIEMKVQ
jgi:hypothetical protein